MNKKLTTNYKTTILGITLAILMSWQNLDIDHPFSPKSIFSLTVSAAVATLGFLLKDDILNGSK